MAKIERFEDLQSWQKALQLANVVYDMTGYSTFAKDFQLSHQIRGAAGSVMLNIAKGFDSGTDPEFIRFLELGRRSAREEQSEIYLALDRKHITRDEHRVAYNLATETKQLINALIAYLRRSK